MQLIKNKKIYLSVIIVLFFVSCILPFNVVQAQDELQQPASQLLENFVTQHVDPLSAQLGNEPWEKKEFPEMVGTILYWVLGLLGVGGLVLVIIAGIMWMTAEGNEEKVQQAKNLLKGAVIGIVIILAAYAITFFVVSEIMKGTEGGLDTGGGETPPECPEPCSSYLNAGTCNSSQFKNNRDPCCNWQGSCVPI